ncbi:Chloride channel protein CLC-c [Morus notabilis]|uniref:Chloride channel protein CLC-c n=1 Tax=Morus notabilis TaxID=981085 RepID=W9RIG0_9ROSA|nr:Chloride channel protein CLC-c [Morus notabilis]
METVQRGPSGAGEDNPFWSASASIHRHRLHGLCRPGGGQEAVHREGRDVDTLDSAAVSDIRAVGDVHGGGADRVLLHAVVELHDFLLQMLIMLLLPLDKDKDKIVESEIFKQDWRSRNNVQIFQYVVLKWAFALLVGLGTRLVGVFNNTAVENISGFKLYLKAFMAYAGCTVGLAVAAGALCAFVAPAAAGSGIPEVKAYLNGVDAHSILAPSTLLVKLRYFKNDREQRDLITCGAAAGVAAAFVPRLVVFSLPSRRQLSGASIKGFKAMRKVIAVDGTFLKTKYKRTLIISIAHDGNYHQYPLAWAVVDSENDELWKWFMTKLEELIPDDEELVIISNRHQCSPRCL